MGHGDLLYESNHCVYSLFHYGQQVWFPLLLSWTQNPIRPMCAIWRNMVYLKHRNAIVLDTYTLSGQINVKLWTNYFLTLSQLQ